MVQIANPIYDVVFRYLMKDERLARLLLSAIIGKEVLSLEFRPTEHALSVSETLTVLRMDFSARIVDPEGRQELVIIELQKARMVSDIMRFRRYLGNQYANKENVFRDSEGEGHGSQKALPILSIYFLGEPLPRIKAPVVRVNRIYTDAATGEQIHDKEEFIESLTHDSIVIQVPYLKGHRRNELEQLLSIFDQSLATNNRKLMLIDELELPARYHPLLRKLHQAMSNPTIRETMEAEDEVVEDFRTLQRVISDKEAIIEEKDEALQEKDEALQEQAAIIMQQQQQLALAILKSHAAGLDIRQLSAIFSLEENEIQAIIAKHGSTSPPTRQKNP
ncbi:MAG: hypothetical protein RI973_1837 [Bacteroidota bacterium]|jgi:hypothetical protein